MKRPSSGDSGVLWPWLAQVREENKIRKTKALAVIKHSKEAGAEHVGGRAVLDESHQQELYYASL